MIDDRLGMVCLLDDRPEYDASDYALDGAQAEPAPGKRERYGRVKVRAKASGCAQGHAEQTAEAEPAARDFGRTSTLYAARNTAINRTVTAPISPGFISENGRQMLGLDA